MFNKVNSKYLIISFVVLLALVLLLIPNRNSKKSSSFKSDITEFDTTKASVINIFPRAGGNLVTLEKQTDQWFVTDGSGKYNADNAQINHILGTIGNLKAKRLVARSKDKWKDYELNDSLGTRVQVLGGKKTLADIYIGKFDYKQPPQTGNPYMQRQQGTMTTFVRRTGEKDVFAVDGFLGMTFNRSVDDFRDRKIIKSDQNAISRLSFSQPDGSYDLVKQGNSWMIDGLVADSAIVAGYLTTISNLNGGGFVSEDNKPVVQPSHVLTVETGAGTNNIVVDSYFTDSTNIALSSSMNPGTFFNGTVNELHNKIYKRKNSFFKE